MRRKTTALCMLLAAAPAAALATDAPGQTQGGPTVTLADALRLAAGRNLDLEATRAEIQRAEADLARSWSALYPSASAGLTWTHNDREDTLDQTAAMAPLFDVLGVPAPDAEPTVTRRQDDLAGSLQVNVPLVNAQAWTGIGVGRLGVTVAEITVETRRRALSLSVAQAHHQALTLQSLLRTQDAQLAAAEHHEEVALTRFRSGIGSRLDTIRAETAVEQARDQLVATRAGLESARDALAVLLNTDGLPVPAPEPAAGPGTDPAAGLEEVADALARRPDLELQRRLLDLTAQQVKLTRRGLLPTLGAQGRMTWDATGMLDDEDDTVRWAALVTLTIPLYSPSLFAEVDRQEASLTQARWTLAAAEQRAALELRQGARDVARTAEQVASARRQAGLARETETLTRTAYASGTGSSLEVIDAQRTSRQAELTLASRGFDARMAELSLLYARGVEPAEWSGGAPVDSADSR